MTQVERRYNFTKVLQDVQKIFIRSFIIHLETGACVCKKYDEATRQWGIAIVRCWFKMGLQLVERRLKTLRRLFQPLPAEVWSMLKNSATLFASAPCQDVVDA